MTEILTTMGQRLQDLRKAKGLKQSDMAKLLDITERSYQRYEYGKINLPATTIVYFAEFFDVSTDYLLGRSEDAGRDISNETSEE